MEQTILKYLLSFVISPFLPLLIGFIILIVYFTRAKTNYMSINKILVDYFDIFSSGTTAKGQQRYGKSHLVAIWGVPFLFSLSVFRINVDSADLYNALIVFLSILISMFFSILSILISKQTRKSSASDTYYILLKESGTIILVEIILCIVCLILSIFLLFAGEAVHFCIIYIIRIIYFYFIFVMLLNILILIKRLKSLIDNPQ